MKKTITLLLALVLTLTAVSVFADGRTAPEDKKTITTTDVIGVETVFRKYDNKFYEAASEQPALPVLQQHGSRLRLYSGFSAPPCSGRKCSLGSEAGRASGRECPL